MATSDTRIYGYDAQNLFYETTPTGIDGLDQILGGGFIRGRSYLISGETGTGKTLISLTFLLQGALRLGEAGIYVSVDETYEQLVMGAKRFGWDLEELRAKGLIEILVPEMDLIERIREKDPTAIAKSLIASLRDYVAALNAQRLVIDPIAPLVTMEKDVQVLREYIRVLVMGIEREIGTTNIVTTEIPSGSTAISRYGVEEFLAAGVMVTGIAKARDGSFKRVIFIRKMRWSPVPPGLYEFDIVPKEGVVVKSAVKEPLIPVTFLPSGSFL